MKTLLLLLLLPVYALSQNGSTIDQIPAPMPNTYVNDHTGVLSRTEITTLNDSLLALERRSGVQGAIVLVDKLPEGMVIEDFVRLIGRKWRVGNAHNGFVYVAAFGDRKQRLEVADHLEGDLPDITALAITEEFKPYFRRKEYFEGLQVVVGLITEHVDPVAKEHLRLLEIEREKKNAATLFNILIFIVCLLGAAGLIYLIFFRPKHLRLKREAAAEAERQRSMVGRRYEGYAGGNARIISGEILNPDQLYHPLSSYIPSSSIGSQSSHSDDNDNSSSSSSSGSSDSDSSYGSWGSDSSSSDDATSGFSGGGASNDL